MNQLNEYLQDEDLYSAMQSAYRQNHSTETATLHIQNNLLCTLDRKREAMLVLLDYSSAFDIIDHHILLQRLKTRYGISGTVLKWFSSYLKERLQTVSIRGKSSYDVIFNSGVPQGSVVGPLLFALYTAPLEDVIFSLDVHAAVYADDTQLYIDFNPGERENDAVRKLQKCMDDVHSWSASNKLCLNSRKTECLHMTSKFSLKSKSSDSPTDPPSLIVDHQPINPNESARSLGIIVDHNLRMTDHVNNICRSSFAALRGIGRIRQYLDDDSTAKLVHAFVTSRLDLCNSLLYGLPESETRKLQRVQNSAARIVARTPPGCQHITPTLEALHWLPVRKRSTYKILLLTYKSLHGMAPGYTPDLLQEYRPPRQLRSSSANLLVTPPHASTGFYGERAFKHAAPSLWNNLPESIRNANTLATFKKVLKTHLFKQ